MKINLGTGELKEAVDNYIRALMPNIEETTKVDITLTDGGCIIVVGDNVEDATVPEKKAPQKKRATRTKSTVKKTEEAVTKTTEAVKKEPMETPEEEELDPVTEPEEDEGGGETDVDPESEVDEEDEGGETVQDVINDMENKPVKTRKKKSIFS